MLLHRFSNVNLLYFLFFFFFRHLISGVSGNLPAPYYPVDDIAINSGSTGNSSALDGREWMGDEGSSKFSLSRKQIGKSISSIATHTSLSGDPVPYLTARVSHSQFFYTFRVQPGQKFIRLHFNAASYLGFEKSRDFFTVQAGPYKLLSNFSASLTAGVLGVKSFVKEFCINVEQNEELTITFSPSPSSISGDAYAFINGIEIVSMPADLYHTRDGDLGVPVVGQNYRFYIDNNTALEMVHRLNVGGSSISPIEDSGMYRRWSKDSDYLLERNRVFQLNHATSIIKYTTSTPSFTAPLKVYQTAWSMSPKNRGKNVYNYKWELAVNLGFRYLVRLHFCQHKTAKTKSGQMVFGIFINNQVAETNADVIKWSGGYGVAAYRDYIVTMRGDRMMGKQYIIISLHPKDISSEGALNGLEVFKLSSPDNNLADPNPATILPSPTWIPNLGNYVLAFGNLNSIATRLIMLITTLNIIVYIQRYVWEGKYIQKSVSSSPEKLCRRFSLVEMHIATQNFNDAFVIGIGGFAKVYKGLIDDGAKTVAIKRLRSNSQEGAREFWTEIEMICNLRHNHLVSLIGYCNDAEEMVLVYEYMPCGTLGEHLYNLDSNQRNSVPLPWEQRLKICVDAARGLDYLHTGTITGVIHRDVKTSNILLDENLVGKISDFGLSKVEKVSHLHQSYMSTNIKGTVGYLDPDYFLSHRLSRKSDVYAFGVVLFEVLCGRPAVDGRLDEEQRSLAIWARHCIREDKLDQIIDPSLRGKISPNSRKVFVEIAEKCLHNQPKKRPTMATLVSRLEFALEQQDRVDWSWSISEEATDVNAAQGKCSPSPSFHTVYSLSDSTNSKVMEKVVKRSGSGFKYKRLMSNLKWDSIWNGSKSSKIDSLSPVNSKLETACRCFTISEIQVATNNFDNDLIVGHDEFSTVYKAYINGGSTNVAMKRFKRFMTEDISRKDCAAELCREIEMLSQLQHPHLVPLIGYCYNVSEMILVYEYMVNGTLCSRLYGVDCIDPLTWNERLHICVGTAQGLNFLHTGSGNTVIHCNVKPANIMLDYKLVAKVSDFGLCSAGPMYALRQNLTCVLNTCLEYLDPEFEFANGAKLTEKSDVYSFGLVLLQVLCARKLEDHTLEKDQVFLRSWFKSNIAKKTVHQIVDPSLKGKIAPECLREFVKITGSCLADKGVERPSMRGVVKSLEFAIQLQEAAEAKRQPIFDEFDMKNMYT